MSARTGSTMRGCAAVALCVAVLSACFGDDGDDTPTQPQGDPYLTSWRVDLGGRYARVIEVREGQPVTVWPATGLLDTSGSAAIPAYSDVQRVSYDSQWVYVESSGLASHQMGPWYWNAQTLFGNWPRPQGYTYRIPRTPVEKPDAERVSAGLGPQGAWVNGVSFFNQLDGAFYDSAAAAERQGPAAADFGADPTYIWIRDAIPVEGPSFDASNAHQPPTGQYHYHSNPLALRFQAGDNVVWDDAKGAYVESTQTKTHSPLLGWARDGYPIYGPYGYTDCTGSDTAVSRMRSGFVLRNGQQGTSDLRVTGRTSVGKWAAQLHQLPATAVDANGRVALEAARQGPAISTYFYLGRYNEDYEFLGDMGRPQGTDYDLDRHNGRSCRTPEFPNGTYAYHVTIDDSGVPAYPYTVGRQFRGDPTGGTLADGETIPATATQAKVSPLRELPEVSVSTQSSGRRVEWPAAEGAVYKLESSVDGGLTWAVVAETVRAPSASGSTLPGRGFFTLSPLMAGVTDAAAYIVDPTYRLTQLSVAPYEAGATAATKGRVESVSPAALTRGTPAPVEITMLGNQPLADVNVLATAQPMAVELVSTDGNTVIATATEVVRTLNVTKATVDVPAGAAPGTYMWRLRFGAPDPLQSSYQSVNQLIDVPAAAIDSRVSYRDLPVTVQ